MRHQSLLNFSIKATLLFVLAFGVHLSLLKSLELPLFAHQIGLSYGVNLGLIILIFAILFLLKNRFKAQLGFLFLAGSLVKFAVFFVVFYPTYKLDGLISKGEFTAFFVPYIIGLIFESLSLSKWLNTLD